MTMRVIDVPEEQLFDAPRNANRMEPEMYDRLVESVRRFGLLQPVLVRRRGGRAGDPEIPLELEIVAGHHRVHAAREAGLKSIPCLDVSGLSPEQIETLRLALNRIHGNPDLAIVADVLKDLTEHGIEDLTELEVTGFSAVEIKDLLDSLNRGEQDDMLAPQEPVEEQSDKPKPFTLEIEFASKKMYEFCRRKLRKAAGKGDDLYVGLMRALGEDPGEDKWHE